MTFGTGPWGSTPWGGGAPSVGGSVEITGVEYITPTYLRLDLNTQVIVNTNYLNKNNYSVAVRTDAPIVGDSVSIVRVITPAQETLVADYVYLETSRHTNGSAYEANFLTLNTLDGVAGTSAVAVPYSARSTKTMQMLKSMPSHFDKRVDSLLHAILSAISLQDDRIGGSRNDEFPASTGLPIIIIPPS